MGHDLKKETDSLIEKIEKEIRFYQEGLTRDTEMTMKIMSLCVNFLIVNQMK